MCIVGTCCGCCGLDKGAIGIGAFGLIINIIALCSSFSPINWGQIIGALLGVVANGLLLWSVKVRQAVYALVWLVLSMIQIVMLVIGFCIMLFIVIVGGVATSGDDSGHAGAGWAVVSIISSVIYVIILGLSIYFWVVIWSWYKSLKGGAPAGTEMGRV